MSGIRNRFANSFQSQVRSLAGEIGSDAAVCFSLLGMSNADARKFYSLQIGKRLLAHDPADKLGVVEFASLLNINLQTLGDWRRLGAVPEADAPEARDPKWSLTRVASWLCKGCPNAKTGKPNRYVCDDLGI